MNRIQRLMKLHRLMKPAGDEGSDNGGTGTGDAAALAAAAAKVEADAAAAAVVAAAAAAEAAKGKPTDAEAKLLKDLMTHKTNSAALAAQLAEVQAKLKAFDGIDLVAHNAAQAEAAEVERKRAIAAGEFERLTTQMAATHAAEQKTAAEKIAAAESGNAALQKQIADLTVGSSFASSKFVTEDMTLTATKARVIYGSHFEFKDGKVVGYDKPASASDRTMLVSSTGESLSFEDALKKIVDADPEKDQLIRSKMKPGAGSTTNVKGAARAAGEQGAQLDAVSKIAAGLKALAKKT